MAKSKIEAVVRLHLLAMAILVRVLVVLLLPLLVVCKLFGQCGCWIHPAGVLIDTGISIVENS
jgi:hypothetical protein